MSRVIYRSSTLISVASSVTITDILNFSVPAGMLGTNKMIRGKLVCDYLNNGAATSTLTITAVYGATTMFADATAANAIDADVRPCSIDFTLSALGATNSQRFDGVVEFGNVNTATTGVGDMGATDTGSWGIQGAAAEDSTAAKTLQIRVTHSKNNANTRFRMHYATLELI